MSGFAETYPQLLNQARERGVDTDAVRTAYELAERMADGVYRPYGTPFLCHLVRTASILLVTGEELELVLAGLVHAAYSVPPVWRRASRTSLRRALGGEVEELVHAYDRLEWNSEAALREHLRRLDGYPEQTRRVLVLRLANETEEYLDGSLAFVAGERERRRPLQEPALALAGRLGRGELERHMARAFHACGPEVPPATMLVKHRSSYSLRTKNLPQAPWLRRAVRAVIRGLRGRGRPRG